MKYLVGIYITLLYLKKAKSFNIRDKCNLPTISVAFITKNGIFSDQAEFVSVLLMIELWSSSKSISLSFKNPAVANVQSPMH